MKDQSDAIVYVVDDDPAARKSLAFLVESAGFKARPCESAAEFLNVVNPAVPGCAVLDVRMPELSGLDLQSKIGANGEAMPIIFVTAYGDISTAVRAMKGGAFDFLEKPVSDEMLISRITAAVDRHRRVRESVERRRSVKGRLATLSPREREVMDMVVDGRATRGIADALGLSAKTVEAHRSHLMHKMKAASIAELVRMRYDADDPPASL